MYFNTNIIDLFTNSSLISVKLPEVTYNSDTEMCEVDINVQHSLIVNKIPVSTTFIIFDKYVMILNS